MKDRTGKDLPVKNHCRFCYNTIYNPSPLSLLGQEKLIRRLAPGALRLAFTLETPEQMKALIQEIVDGENKKKPYSDQAISDQLAVKGIKLSRRTVNKYRTEMGIPDKSGRKEF